MPNNTQEKRFWDIIFKKNVTTLSFSNFVLLKTFPLYRGTKIKRFGNLSLIFICQKV